MKLQELMDTLNTICPFSLQEDFDNSGLQVGNLEKEIQTIFLAFDFTEAVFNEAVQTNADVIITHHPFLFHSLKTVSSATWQGKMIFSLVQQDIALVALHTNLDKIDYGVNMQLGKDLGLLDLTVFLPEESGMGLGAVGKLPTPMSFGDLLAKVKTDLNCEALKYAGQETDIVSSVGVLGGAGAEFMDDAKNRELDVYISSDFKYHDAQKAQNIGLKIIDAGHFRTEVGVVKAFAEKLADTFPTTKIVTATVMEDYWQYK